MICPSCGDARMSTPMFGRRTGLWLSTCVACGFTSRSQTPPTVQALGPDHAAMFRQTAPARVPVSSERFARFDRPGAAATARKAILSRRELERVNANDPKLKQAGDR